ncbi:MAG TPA: DUF4232 domain-containing protein [Streptosporangiaceae bacterium]|nr:DUF4232 domain-containing protein [Streptosporangiaceae bacterium]
MKLSPRLIRRVSATAAAVAAAVLIPAVALAAPGRAARPAAPGCGQAQLQAWIGLPASAAAGTVYYQLEISNISARTCTLLGFPGVSAVDGNGTQLGSPAQRDHSYPVRLLTLARGATAHVELGIGTAENYPVPACHPVAASGLRVFAPGDFRSETIPFPDFHACRTAGPKLLIVSPVLAGTGIPHFSH